MPKRNYLSLIIILVCIFLLALTGCKFDSAGGPILYSETGEITPDATRAAPVSSLPTSLPTPVLMTSRLSGWVVYSFIVSSEPFVSQIFLKNLDTGEVTQLTHSGNNSHPRWSPDGSQILYESYTKGNSDDIYLMDKDGSHPRPLVVSPVQEIMAEWSPDGNKIAFVSNRSGRDEIYVIEVDSKEVFQVTDSVTAAYMPSWSLDGNQIAFSSISNTNGAAQRTQIFVMNADGSDVRQLTESDVDHFDGGPVWCPKSECIIFSRNGSKLMRLDLASGEATPLLNNVSFLELDDGAVGLARSPVRGYLTFFADGEFYALDLENQQFYLLEMEDGTVELSLYP